LDRNKYPPPPHCQGFLHQVRPGESLYKIAKNTGIALRELVEANPQITNPHSLEEGQLICIPIKGSAGKTIFYSTGPLAIDPLIQSFIGVIVENNTGIDIKAIVRLFDKDPCPKFLAFKLLLDIPAGCAFTPFFDIPGFFYEVLVEVPALPDILIAVYGLTGQFGVVAANTLRHSELTLLMDPPVIKDSPRDTATLTASPGTGRWVKAFD